MRIFSQELGMLYKAFAQRRPPVLPDLPIQYVEYAHWQRSWLCGETLAGQMADWRARLACAETRAMPHLSLDEEREFSMSYCAQPHLNRRDDRRCRIGREVSDPREHPSRA